MPRQRKFEGMLLNGKRAMHGTGLAAAFTFVFLIVNVHALEFKTRHILIETAHKKIELVVEIADTSELRSKGLMFRTELAPMTGMLFDFNKTTKVFMWMKNTLLSLDMLFVDDRGRISHIVKGAKPESLDVISPPQPVRFVLEVKAGFVDKNNVKVGDVIQDIMFK
jgi:uncharacterized protein